MADKKFGNKRLCSNCETKFYDLNKDSPLTCPHCKTEMSVDEDLQKLNNNHVLENTKKPEANDEFAEIDNNENVDEEDVISLDDPAIEEENKS